VLDVICGMRPKPRNHIHTIVSWCMRRNTTGPWHPRTKVNDSLQTGRSQNLQNPLRMWPYCVLGVKGVLETVFAQTHFPKPRQFDDDHSTSDTNRFVDRCL